MCVSRSISDNCKEALKNFFCLIKCFIHSLVVVCSIPREPGTQYEAHKIGEIFNSHAQKATGYFWFASTEDARDYFDLHEAIEVMHLQGPMRNSGKILKHVCEEIENMGESPNDYLVNEQYFPQGLDVSVYEETEGDDHQTFEQALQEMLTYRESTSLTMFDMIVVIIPNYFMLDKSMLFDVAEDLGLSAVKYFSDDSDELPDLMNFCGVLFTDQDMFSGCEAKLVIVILNSGFDGDATAVNSMLRCVTKLIIVKSLN